MVAKVDDLELAIVEAAAARRAEVESARELKARRAGVTKARKLRREAEQALLLATDVRRARESDVEALSAKILAPDLPTVTK